MQAYIDTLRYQLKTGINNVYWYIAYFHDTIASDAYFVAVAYQCACVCHFVEHDSRNSVYDRVEI